MNTTEGYQLVQRLGRGVSGTVYVAETGRQRVAIRQFDSAAALHSEAWNRERQQFMDAGRQALRLKHPHIVRVLEVIDEAGEALISMEYVAGETLEAALAARRMSRDEAHLVLRQVAQALDFAHARGVVHGDLKPSNIFLTPKGAKVSDFAISPRARRQTHQPVPARLVHGYLSPEHLRDRASVDARSDQYSLAVIAYEMYTGQSPYGNGAGDVSGAILRAPVAPPSQVDPGLPSGMDEPLLKALAREPEQRHPSSMEFVAQLDATQATRRASNKVYAIAGALVLAMVVALIWLWPRTARKAAPTTAAIPRPVIVQFTAFPDSVRRGRGDKVKLSWSVRQADRVSIDPGIGDVPPEGSRTLSPKETTSYKLIAAGNGKATTSNVTVHVADAAAIAASLIAAPTQIRAGAATEISWDVKGARQISIDHGIGTVTARGRQTVAPRETTIYTLTAASRTEHVTKTATIEVIPAAPQPPPAAPSVSSSVRPETTPTPAPATPAPPQVAEQASPKPPVRIHVDSTAQAAKLIRQVNPVYPPLAVQARISGNVMLDAVIGRDGTVQALHLVSGHPMLIAAAMEAVKQWVYQPTLVNGEPVEVETAIDVHFAMK